MQLADFDGFTRDHMGVRGTFLGIPMVNIILFGGLYWAPPFWEAAISTSISHRSYS